jgi:hypothetical protein
MNISSKKLCSRIGDNPNIPSAYCVTKRCVYLLVHPNVDFIPYAII